MAPKLERDANRSKLFFSVYGALVTMIFFFSRFSFSIAHFCENKKTCPAALSFEKKMRFLILHGLLLLLLLLEDIKRGTKRA